MIQPILFIFVCFIILFLQSYFSDKFSNLINFFKNKCCNKKIDFEKNDGKKKILGTLKNNPKKILASKLLLDDDDLSPSDDNNKFMVDFGDNDKGYHSISSVTDDDDDDEFEDEMEDFNNLDVQQYEKNKWRFFFLTYFFLHIFFYIFFFTYFIHIFFFLKFRITIFQVSLFILYLLIVDLAIDIFSVVHNCVAPNLPDNPIPSNQIPYYLYSMPWIMCYFSLHLQLTISSFFFLVFYIFGYFF